MLAQVILLNVQPSLAVFKELSSSTTPTLIKPQLCVTRVAGPSVDQVQVAHSHSLNTCQGEKTQTDMTALQWE